MSENKFYHPEYKKKFLNEFSNNIDSQTTYSYLFYKSAVLEEVLKKDLFNFNIKELGQVIANADPLTPKVARSYSGIISSYINWAIKEQICIHSNPLKDLYRNWFNDYVVFNKIYMTDKEIMKLEDNLVNPQDAVIIRLIFEGINGHGSSEILNIKKEDVIFDRNTIQLLDDREVKREVKVSERCISMMEKAFDQVKYLNKNGEAENEKRAHSLLVENEFLLRSNRTRTINEGRADKHLIYRRITMISDKFDLPFLTAKNIEKSGMIKMAKDLLKGSDEITNEILKEICKQFGVKKTKIGMYEAFPYGTLRDFIHMDNIEDLYGG